MAVRRQRAGGCQKQRSRLVVAQTLRHGRIAQHTLVYNYDFGSRRSPAHRRAAGACPAGGPPGRRQRRARRRAPSCPWRPDAARARPGPARRARVVRMRPLVDRAKAAEPDLSPHESAQERRHRRGPQAGQDDHVPAHPPGQPTGRGRRCRVPARWIAVTCVLNTLWDGLSNALLMAWAVCWALVLGFAISAIVQAWVPRQRIEDALGGTSVRPIALATGLGAASSSCSYAAIAIAKSLFAKGASAASALAFQFASTNLVVELGAVIWVLIGWQFTLAELVGGLALIAIMTALLRLFVSQRLEESARAHAQHADNGHQHHAASTQVALRERLTSIDSWSDVAHNFRNDWSMLWKEITLGFVLAGFIGLLGNGFFARLFGNHRS